MINLSISFLVEDNWWWRPDFLSLLEDLMKTVEAESLSRDDIVRRLRIPLTEVMGERDPHISELKSPGKVLRISEIWTPRLLYLLRKNFLEAEGKYVLVSLRGPRRVGKTTLIKLLIRELLLNRIDPLKIAYIRCDRAGLGGVNGLANVIRDFIIRRRDRPGDTFIFLDEVSSLKNWQLAVKDLYDSGLLTRNHVKLLVTGSHSLDVRKGAETLGLRKGVMLEGGNDKLLLPMKFSEYAYYREMLAGKRDIRSLFISKEFLKVERRLDAFNELTRLDGGIPPFLEMAETYLNELYAYFEDYLLTGGFPLAVRQFLTLGRIHPSVYLDFVDLAVKDAMKWRLNENTLYDILYQLLEAPRGPFEAVPVKEISDNKLANKLGISHNTVRQYLNYLVDAFVLIEVGKLKDFSKRKSPLRSPRKFYFWDPLMFYAFKAISAGSSDPYSLVLSRLSEWRGVIVEMVVASNIAHMIFSLEIIQDIRLLKRKMFYFKSKPGREIDFLIDVKGRLIPIEVYSGNKVDSDHIKKLVRLSKQLKVRGILVYAGMEFYRNKDFIAIPAPLFMLLA
ncbi:MAG: ATP-binding protein [archaeon GB-1867-005]|nr:ATP-binding protein [Candidatus Culexmicrobium cathedralense]